MLKQSGSLKITSLYFTDELQCDVDCFGVSRLLTFILMTSFNNSETIKTEFGGGVLLHICLDCVKINKVFQCIIENHQNKLQPIYGNP